MGRAGSQKFRPLSPPNLDEEWKFEGRGKVRLSSADEDRVGSETVEFAFLTPVVGREELGRRMVRSASAKFVSKSKWVEGGSVAVETTRKSVRFKQQVEIVSFADTKA